MNVDDLLDAPRVDMPVVPGPVDCMPRVLAAGRVAPVVKVGYYGGTVWDVCDMELARAALADRRLSKDIELTPDWMRIPGAMLGGQPGAEVARAMIMSEGSEHARIRQAHAWIFTPRNTEKWAARLARLAEDLLDELAGEVDLVERYTYPLPLGFFCEMLGLPPELHPDLKRVTDSITYSPDQAARAGGAGALAGAVAGWISDPGPLREGVITSLLEEVQNDVITVDEAVTWTVSLVMAGYEPSASLIAATMFEALRQPADQRPRSEAEIEAWIEEILRVHPSAMHATWRFATEDLDLGGYFIPKGAPVQINIAAANRCPRGELADEFDPGASRGHISFGLGHHYCLGAPLARLEARVALGAFLSRFPNARLSDTTEVRWESEWMTRRIRVLPVALAHTGSPRTDHGRYDQRG
ncbi:MAG TPA: cytochrome P450 [Amycolatopsis sp.]|uniref:cytochrome P450 n=1 Tax=Amycolatopsis sp. TaxID=37632 RepID=UPI002B47047A|nr:cytochrome P450 [Amycolatopsis sp.]HKS46595.1 cytochrome P450 [Amycolatopsis sp.]